jgi:plastocyanin
MLTGIALALAACAPWSQGTPSTTEQPQVVRLTSVIRRANFAFEPDAITVRASVPVRLEFDNRTPGPDSGRGVPHSVTMDLGRPGWLVGIFGPSLRIGVEADSQAVGEFVLAPGSYEFYCDVYDHRAGGMVGTILAEVRPPSLTSERRLTDVSGGEAEDYPSGWGQWRRAGVGLEERRGRCRKVNRDHQAASNTGGRTRQPR